MATRFYLPGAGTAPITPAYDTNWEQTTGAVRYPLVYKNNRLNLVTVSSNTITVPITTTQDCAATQFISDPLQAMVIKGTFSLVVRVLQNATTVNATLACVVRVLSKDGLTVRGTLFSVFGTDTAYPLTGAPATRIVNAQNVTQTTVQPGDRLVVEIGVRATAPSTSDTTVHRTVNDSSLADYALTSGLTTSINPWCEFSQDLFPPTNSNYQFVKVGDGMSVSEKIR